MSQHTTGPWKFLPHHTAREDNAWMVVLAEDPRGFYKNNSTAVAHCFGPDKLANARLIIKAPELYELAKAIAAGNTEIAHLEDQARALVAEVEA